MPYASIEDLRAAGLGIINESDAWMTGRPYGLPGTATIRLDQQHGGYHDPNGYHYNAAMVGGGFGDVAADQAAAIAALQTSVAKQNRVLVVLSVAAVISAVGTAITLVSSRRSKRRGGY